jgi:hypothetical protein
MYNRLACIASRLLARPSAAATAAATPHSDINYKCYSAPSVHEDVTPRGVNPPLQPLLQVQLDKCNIVVVAELAQVLVKESPKQLARLETHPLIPLIRRPRAMRAAQRAWLRSSRRAPCD